MAGDEGPEPTGWELMRGLNEVKDLLRTQAAKYVDVGVYRADTKGNDERHDRAEGRITELEKSLQDADKLKRAQALTIALAITVPIITLVGNYFISHP